MLGGRPGNLVRKLTVRVRCPSPAPPQRPSSEFLSPDPSLPSFGLARPFVPLACLSSPGTRTPVAPRALRLAAHCLWCSRAAGWRTLKVCHASHASGPRPADQSLRPRGAGPSVHSRPRRRRPCDPRQLGDGQGDGGDPGVRRRLLQGGRVTQHPVGNQGLLRDLRTPSARGCITPSDTGSYVPLPARTRSASRSPEGSSGTPARPAQHGQQSQGMTQARSQPDTAGSIPVTAPPEVVPKFVELRWRPDEVRLR